MRAIILAAGRGSRMGAETADKPKCHAMLAGRTLLEWQTASLREAGISEIVVVRGYRKELLVGDFLTVDNPSWERTNMAGSLVCAARWLAEAPAIVSYSDIVYHPDHVRALAACDARIAITADRSWLDLWRLRSPDPLADAETFREQDGYLLEIGGKPETVAGIPGQYMGLLLFRPEGWSELHGIFRQLPPERQARLDMTSWLSLAIERRVAVRALYVDGRWCEVDCGEDRSAYEEKIRRVDTSGGSWSHDWRWQ